jgi:hypothetical protein
MRIQIVDHEVNRVGSWILPSDILEHLGKRWPLPVWRRLDEVPSGKRFYPTEDVCCPSTHVLIILDS